MNRSSAFRAAVAGLLFASAVAVTQAAPVYQIDATTDGQPVDIGQFSNLGFTLSYEDSDGNHRFSLSELLAFTPVFDGTNFFEQLVGLPDLPGLVGTGGNEWVFRDVDGMPDWRAPAAMFTPYTSDPFAVPEPGSLALGLTCLAALGLTRRQHRGAAEPACAG